MQNKKSDDEQPEINVGSGCVNGVPSDPVFVFAHGAGAGMDSEFMERVAKGLAASGVRVYRFDFPYMQLRKQLGSKRPPDRAPKLLQHFKQELLQLKGPLVIGGKSMGGRMASLLASELATDSTSESAALLARIQGVIAFGYPFHPANKPENLRTEHFEQLSVPMCVLQGTRDKLGDAALVSQLNLPTLINAVWFEDGDHDLKPRKASGYTHEQHMGQAIKTAAGFIKEVLKSQ